MTNPTVQPSYAASAAVFTSTALDALAASATWVAGWGSAIISNTSNLYDDVLLSGQFKAIHTPAPTAGQIRVYVGATINDTPAYPDAYGGSSAALTWTTVDIRDAVVRLAAVMITDATVDRVYQFNKISVADLFGAMPDAWFVWATHSMVQTLNATGSAGGQCWYTGIKYIIPTI